MDDFKNLKATPFGGVDRKKLYKPWNNLSIFRKWYNSQLKELNVTDEYVIKHLDVDEIALQWDISEDDRKFNPKTCTVMYKELALCLRSLSANHEWALKNNTIPGVTYSPQIKQYITRVISTDTFKDHAKMFNTEEEAYEAYRKNRNTVLCYLNEFAKKNNLIKNDIYEVIKNIELKDYYYYRSK